jgi:predicted short-subunit dehydrogenase-like oxidoreductase (DUF2520 family)
VIVGFGRMGGALALKLKQARWPVSVLPRSDDAVRRAARWGVPLADHDALKQCELCILAVPDGAIASVADHIEGDLGPKSALVHLAGARDLNAFGSDPRIMRRRRGSFHPLAAVSDSRDALDDHAVALAASDPALMPVLWRMAMALHLKPFEVSEAHRALYHAGAVMAAGLTVSLLDAAVEAFSLAQVDKQTALEALLPLVSSALRGVEARGLTRGYTGPIPRGDVSTVEAHLKALPDELKHVYRVLSLRALAALGGTLPKETQVALGTALTNVQLKPL